MRPAGTGGTGVAPSPPSPLGLEDSGQGPTTSDGEVPPEQPGWMHRTASRGGMLPGLRASSTNNTSGATIPQSPLGESALASPVPIMRSPLYDAAAIAAIGRRPVTAPPWVMTAGRSMADLIERPCEVTPGLCIGGWKDTDAALLREHNIAWVLNCTREVEPLSDADQEELRSRGGAYEHLPMEDSTHFDITHVWEEARSFVDTALRQFDEQGGGRCLVHCVRGRSRSACILLFCMMSGSGGRPKPSLREALRWLWRRRGGGNVGVNFGFFELLVAEDARLRGGVPSVTLDEYSRCDSEEDEVLPTPKAQGGRQELPQCPAEAAAQAAAGSTADAVLLS
eukprot:TRINITY_DN24835_c0_g1_i1.p1 TRINITY_DN24835_c0_g1~~TRINITY_DN24835_c0_g1_i1.p1  ORF type:complete len:339 (+),score=44.94 TRINITY_DN24835_c0_g1_i1:80-1096(+)